MLRRLWLEFLLWVYNVCPEHGPMAEGCGPGGVGGVHHYCQRCNERSREEHEDNLAKLQREYREVMDATKP